MIYNYHMLADCQWCVDRLGKLLEKEIFTGQDLDELLQVMNSCPPSNDCPLARMKSSQDYFRQVIESTEPGGCENCLRFARHFFNNADSSVLISPTKIEERIIFQLYTCKYNFVCPLNIWAKVHEGLRGVLIRKEAEDCGECVTRIEELEAAYCDALNNHKGDEERRILGASIATLYRSKLTCEKLSGDGLSCPFFAQIQTLHLEV